MAVSPSHSGTQLVALSEADSQLSSIVYDLSQQVQGAMENMLKMINVVLVTSECVSGYVNPFDLSEIDQNSAVIMEDIEKCRNSAIERKTDLAEEKERFQKAAYTVLNMLNNEV